MESNRPFVIIHAMRTPERAKYCLGVFTDRKALRKWLALPHEPVTGAQTVRVRGTIGARAEFELTYSVEEWNAGVRWWEFDLLAEG